MSLFKTPAVLELRRFCTNSSRMTLGPIQEFDPPTWCAKPLSFTRSASKQWVHCTGAILLLAFLLVYFCVRAPYLLNDGYGLSFADTISSCARSERPTRGLNSVPTCGLQRQFRTRPNNFRLQEVTRGQKFLLLLLTPCLRRSLLETTTTR